MSWERIKSAFTALDSARDSDAPFAAPWQAFKSEVLRSADRPPYHMNGILGAIARHSEDMDTIAILDHGCGSGLTLLYLLALGHTGIHGVDVGGSCEGWNRLLADEYAIDEPQFFLYDGATLPLPDGSIDLVYSQQVLEHVAPAVIESYYAEEARVLRPGGLAFHQVPHRLAPFDSHTRTWVLHYLPRPLYLAVHRRWGKKAAFVEDQLFLRWPWFHRKKIRRHLGECQDLTLARLRALDRFEYYDGPVGLRQMVGRVVRAPVIGAPVGAILRNLVMLDTLSVKRPPPDQSEAGPEHQVR